jgi:heme/copper-type cytochrome/quinol oxidase subunit 4
MDNIRSNPSVLVAPHRNTMPLTTLIGAILAVILTALAFGSAMTSADAPMEDPPALTLYGP